MLLVVPAKVKKPAESGAVEGIAGERVEVEVGDVALEEIEVTATGVADGVLPELLVCSVIIIVENVLTLSK